MKNLIRLTGGLILVSGFLLLMCNGVLAYNDKTTHPDLTREIITFYELSTGKKFAEEQKQWLVQGSIDEDFAPRWLNHFYDPVYERGLTTDIPGINGYLAKNWAQFSSYQIINVGNIINLWTGNGPVISGSEWGDFSYEAAVKNYSKNKEKEAYLALGHVIHLIEDMTVPEHTRNDSHPGGPAPSFYENWATTNSAGLTQDLAKRIFNQGRKTVIYGDLASYFNNLADYTNTHFFSPMTIQSDIYAKPKIVFDDGTFAYGKDENNELFDLATIIVDKLRNKNYLLKNDQVLQEYWLRLSRQVVINGAGIINLFSNQAEAAKQVELARQKVEAQQAAQKSSFFSSIINLFKNPGENNQPTLTITSGPTPSAPKINKIQPGPSAQNSDPKPVVPQAINPAPVPVPAPKVATPTLTSTPAPTSTPVSIPTPNSTPAPVVVYSGGGGGGGSTNTTPNSSETASYSNGDLVINEIMYNPDGADTTDGKSHEWIEIYNNSASSIDLTGWKFNDGDNDTNHGLNVPPENGGQGSMTILAAGFVIITAHAETFLADHAGFTGAVVDTANGVSLKNSTSTVEIVAPGGTAIDEVTYYSSWGANGNGKTLERKSATGGSSDPANWGVSSVAGGTPGAANNWLSETATSTELLVALGTDISATTTITGNTTWTLAGSPYRLFFDGQRRPTVAAGTTLTIEPGAKIIPQGGNYTALEIQGTLNAIATSGAPIIFTSIADADDSDSTAPQKGDWLNIAFTASSTGNFDYVEFRYGGGQNLVLPFHEMVDIVGATVSINNSKFENSKSTALHLKDSSGTVQNSVFSDNYCGISVDSSSGVANNTYGNCYGIYTTGQTLSSADLQIKNNRFVRNQLIGIETRSGTAPTIDGNIFADNGYPMKIESSYPSITNSQLANTATSTSVISGIAISDYTHFSQNFTLKKDLPYILEASGGHSPTVDASTTLTVEPGVIFKIGHTLPAINVNGALIASAAANNQIIFTSLKDDLRGGDTNGDGSASAPQNSDWGNIAFASGSTGNFVNTVFDYTGFGFIPHNLPPTNTLAKDFPTITIGHNLMGTMSSDWTSTSGNAFNKIIIHNFATVNPQNFNYKIGIKNSQNNFIAAIELPNLQNISDTELTATVQGQFSIGERYYATVETIQPTGTSAGVADSFSVGQNAAGRLAVAFYEMVPGAPANPALSIDAGATVVVQ